MDKFYNKIIKLIIRNNFYFGFKKVYPNLYLSLSIFMDTAYFLNYNSFNGKTV